MDHAPSIWSLVVIAAGIGALGGIGHLLRYGRRPTALEVLSTIINSGLICTACFLSWFAYSREDWLLGLGIVTMIGLGGRPYLESTLRVVLRVLQSQLGVDDGLEKTHDTDRADADTVGRDRKGGSRRDRRSERGDADD